MIQIQRDRTRVHARYTGVKRVAQQKSLLGLAHGMQANPGLKPKWVQKYWKDAKGQLKVESFGKCAYCEADTDSVTHGDVEHIRPKSVYWWLAYCYDNYCFSCQICNQVYKGDNFPVTGVTLAGPSLAGLTLGQAEALAGTLAPDPVADDPQAPIAAFVAGVAAEKADLPNPYAEDPEPFFKWAADDTLKEVEAQPRKSTARLKKVHKAAEDFLGLNRAELRGLRYRQYSILKVLKAAHDGGGAGQAAALVGFKDMLAPNFSFAAMNRYFVRTVWGINV